MSFTCPICRKPVEEPKDSDPSSKRSPFPFCSDRCKLIDLGRWLDGKYQIPVVDEDLDESAEFPIDRLES